MTPVAARMARELSLDLSQVPASGARVTKEDVARFLAQQPGPGSRVQVPATPAARRVAHELGVDLAQVAGSEGDEFIELDAEGKPGAAS